MAKIVLGKRPKNFKHSVKVQMLDGTEGVIEISYIYRTRKEFGEHVDSWHKEREDLASLEMEEILKNREVEIENAKKEGVDPPKFDLLSQAMLQTKSIEASADYIMTIADGWDLDAPFSKESLEQLADEIPAASAAISSAYRSACTEGRLGN